jgi:hypothetical protein
VQMRDPLTNERAAGPFSHGARITRWQALA